MRTLTLTNDQFDVLYDILQDTVDVIKDDLIEYEDDNGQLQLEDITDYEAYQVFQKLSEMK